MSAVVPQLYDVEKTEKPSTVCVTGATGFIASVVVERLLAAGHTVHATVRDASRTDAYSYLQKFAGAEDRLKFFSSNLLEAGSFDDAIAGCKYVIHTASPFVINIKPGTERETVIDPAVKGVQHVLGAVNKTSSVKRVVVTSSVAAIYGTCDERGEGHRFSEEDWNQTSTETLNAYYYSKKMAEQTAWDMQKAQDKWDLVVINPSFNYGPPKAARAASESITLMKKMLTGVMWPAAPPSGLGWVDVRDVAAAHCVAMLHPEAKGRYICTENSYRLLEVAAAIDSAFPGKYKVPFMKAPQWLVVTLAPLLGYDARLLKMDFGKMPLFDNSKIQRELGLEFLPQEQTIRDMVHAMAELGLVKKP